MKSDNQSDAIGIDIVDFVPNDENGFRTFQTGIIQGEPNDYYHSSPSISSSKLKKIDENLELYKHYSTDSYSSNALVMGEAFHTLVLDGRKTFDKHYLKIPKEIGDRRTKEYKAYKAKAFEDNAELKEIFRADEYDPLISMAGKLNSNPLCKKLLNFKNGHVELTFRTEHYSRYGACLQARPDYINFEGIAETNFEPYIVDLKTIDSLNDSGNQFHRNFINFKYYIQQAFYTAIVNKLLNGKLQVNRFFFIAIAKTKPYKIMLFEMTEDDLNFACYEVNRILAKLENAIACNKFYVPDINIHSLGIPEWFKAKKLNIDAA